MMTTVLMEMVMEPSMTVMLVLGRMMHRHLLGLLLLVIDRLFFLVKARGLRSLIHPSSYTTTVTICRRLVQGALLASQPNQLKLEVFGVLADPSLPMQTAASALKTSTVGGGACSCRALQFGVFWFIPSLELLTFPSVKIVLSSLGESWDPGKANIDPTRGHFDDAWAAHVEKRTFKLNPCLH